MYLVLLETSGNQNYIFSTNKLKENIGASELTYQAGTKWVLEAVEQVSNSKLWSLWRDNDQLREKLLNKELNQPIDSSNDVTVEVIVATSGKALLLTKDKETAKHIIRFVTHKALREAPGLDVSGVISEPFNWEQQSIGEINRQVHQKFASVRSSKPSPALRFLRLPVMDECSTSGLPASYIDGDSEGKSVVRSTVSCSKRQYSNQGFERIKELLKREKGENPSIQFARSLRALYKELDNENISDSILEDGTEEFGSKQQQSYQIEWMSVIHADGNGLGEIFQNFEQHIQDDNLNTAQQNRSYVDKLRKFSIALDICTEKAFLSALDAFTPINEGLVPIVPLVLGGDDLTVLCDGKIALKFTQLFLIAFEKETASLSHQDGIIPTIANKALKVSRLSACAGLAIIKPKFPFSVAYELSERLMQSAKQVKKKVINSDKKPYPCSALDFHVLYDSSNVDFDTIRSKLEVKNGEEKNRLYNRPYVVTSEASLQGAKGVEWAKFHQWTKLEECIKVLVAKDEEGRRKLPNSQMHELRAGLFLGRSIANARYQLIRDRYRDKGILKLAGDENSLFQQEPDTEIYIAGLPDALDAADFLSVESKTDE
jgi:hypothetical protein